MAELLLQNISVVVNLLGSVIVIAFGYGVMNRRMTELETRIENHEKRAEQQNELLQKVAKDIEVIKTNIEWIRAYEKKL